MAREKDAFNAHIGLAAAVAAADQFRQAGGTAAGVALARSQKGNALPGATTNLQNAGTTISRNYITGGSLVVRRHRHSSDGL